MWLLVLRHYMYVLLLLDSWLSIWLLVLRHYMYILLVLDSWLSIWFLVLRHYMYVLLDLDSWLSIWLLVLRHYMYVLLVLDSWLSIWLLVLRHYMYILLVLDSWWSIWLFAGGTIEVYLILNRSTVCNNLSRCFCTVCLCSDPGISKHSLQESQLRNFEHLTCPLDQPVYWLNVNGNSDYSMLLIHV